MKILKPVFKKIKKPFKWIKVFLKQKLGWLDTPRIIPYKGYGNERDVFIRGMITEDKGLEKPKDHHKFWQNLLATIKRFSSDEIPGVRVKAELLNNSLVSETDDLGYFSFHFRLPEKAGVLLTKPWHVVHFELLDEIIKDQPEIHATGEIRIISPDQERIIVSDIDDTVMISHSTQIFRKLRLMLFKNALTRTPFPNIAEFYSALAKGKDEQSDNPFFFVSSSEWNLYDLLEDFFHFNKIPKGVFLLRELNYNIFKFWKSGGGNHEHKYEKIKSLLEFYPGRNFILIGDSGQHDPEIYSRLAIEFPGRIEAIYIRKIRSESLAEREKELYQKLLKTTTSYMEIKDTHEAAYHASENGYIPVDLLIKV